MAATFSLSSADTSISCIIAMCCREQLTFAPPPQLSRVHEEYVRLNNASLHGPWDKNGDESAMCHLQEFH